MSNQITVGSFAAIKERFVKLTSEETFLKEASFAMQIIAKNSQLQKCSMHSIVQAVLNVSQIGLTLNPALRWTYLVPRYNSGSGEMECFLEPSYQGIVKLITDTGSSKQVYCYPVYEGDHFKPIFGSNPEIIHHPEFKSGSKLTHVYAVAKLSDGTEQIEVMSAEDIDRIKEASESYKAFVAGKIKSCVWEMHYSEMARKTAIKRLCKYLPKTEMWDRLASAIDLDNSDYPASDNQKDYIESLLRTSNLDHDVRARYERQLATMTISEAEQVIDFLNDNQLDPIASGHSYSQSQISGKLKAEIDAPKEPGELFNDNQTKTE